MTVERFSAWWRGGAEDELRALLMRAWDPVAVADEPAAADEYDGYLLGLVGTLRTGASAADVAGHLAALERTELGRSTTATDPRLLAAGREIHAWYAGEPSGRGRA